MADMGLPLATSTPPPVAESNLQRIERELADARRQLQHGEEAAAELQTIFQNLHVREDGDP